MVDNIKKELQKLEDDNKIKVLYAVESGSRAWGFASKDSDWDVRFIYVHHYDWYLSVEEKKDNIEIILPNDIDLGGWELRKALLLFRKSNPPLLEWLKSPIMYKEDYSTAYELRKTTEIYFNPKSCMYHYLHMAQGNYEAYFKEDIVRLKKYFYVLRPIFACCWIERSKEMAPMEFQQLMNAGVRNGELKNEINSLLEKKISGVELEKGKRIKVIDNYIENKLAHFKNYLDGYNFKNSPGFSELNILFRNSLKEAWGQLSD